jgi:hypothetical protein
MGKIGPLEAGWVGISAEISDPGGGVTSAANEKEQAVRNNRKKAGRTNRLR